MVGGLSIVIRWIPSLYPLSCTVPFQDKRPKIVHVAVVRSISLGFGGNNQNQDQDQEVFDTSNMIRARTRFSPVKEVDGSMEWEVRPCGMLVQKRIPEADTTAVAPPAPTIRLKVKYAAVYHEIYLSSQSSFGELKKLLSEKTGLHPQDQKLLFKEKVRDSNAFLDISGVKDGSKMVLAEDSVAKAKRLLETRRAAKLEMAAKSMASIGREVDRLGSQVSALEAIVRKGKKVAESDVLNLIELLMMQLIKLDGIVADGDAKLQRGNQVKRVQKYVETLDAIKIKNSMPAISNGQIHSNQQRQLHQSVAVTKKWETFDSLFTPSTSTAVTPTITSSPAANPKFDWELF